MVYYGDLAPGAILDIKCVFQNVVTGVITALAGSPAFSVYKDNSTTESTAGVTLSASFDGLTGLNQIRIDTSADATFYSAGSNFQVVVTSGTLGLISAVGFVAGSFSIGHRYNVWNAPTSAFTTAGTVGKLIADDLNATISSRSTYAGTDTPGTTTLLSRVSAAITVTGGKVDINDKTGFSLSSAGIQAIWDDPTAAMTAAGSMGKLLTDNVNAAISSRMATYIQPTGFLTSTFPSTVASPTNITAGTISTVSGNVAGSCASVSGAVGSVTGSVGSVVTGVTVTTNNDKTGYGLSSAAIAAVWDYLTSAATTVGSIGKRIADFVGVDPTGIATLLSRVPSTLTITSGKVEVNDRTGFALTSGERAAVATTVWEELVASHTTPGTFGYQVSRIPTGPIRKGQAFGPVPFILRDLSGVALTGKFPTAQCSIDGAAWVTCTNPVVEVGAGAYSHIWSATDLNCIASVLFRYTGVTGARDTFHEVIPE